MQSDHQRDNADEKGEIRLAAPGTICGLNSAFVRFHTQSSANRILASFCQEKPDRAVIGFE
jgi:hypothetical protein